MPESAETGTLGQLSPAAAVWRAPYLHRFFRFSSVRRCCLMIDMSAPLSNPFPSRWLAACLECVAIMSRAGAGRPSCRQSQHLGELPRSVTHHLVPSSCTNGADVVVLGSIEAPSPSPFFRMRVLLSSGAMPRHQPPIDTFDAHRSGRVRVAVQHKCDAGPDASPALETRSSGCTRPDAFHGRWRNSHP